jgi:CspA family cold shock protein
LINILNLIYNILIGGIFKMEIKKGQIKWFNQKKGYGFITSDEGSEYFVHARSISGEDKEKLDPGCRVQFTLENVDKGLEAQNISLV